MNPTDPKPWYQSRTIIGVIVTMLCTLVAPALHVTVAPEMQGELTDVLLAAGGVAGSVLAIYGRLKAARPIGKAGPGATNIAIAFLLLGGLAFGGPVACASYQLTKAEATTPQQKVFALQADYNTALIAVVGYVESDFATDDARKALARLDRITYAAIASAREAVRSGDQVATSVALATARAALTELTVYLAARQREGPGTPAVGELQPEAGS